MSDLTPIQRGISIADSLMGYIAHIPGSVSCRHCELAQEIADALRAVEQATWEEASRFIEQETPLHDRLSYDWILDEFRRLAAGGKSDA